MAGHTFTKAERLCKQTAIDWLFDGKGTSFSVFPLRVVYKTEPVSAITLPKLLISVPKKNFHHATSRNRIKRQLREAYRQQKQTIVDLSAERGLSVTLAFIYTGREHLTTDNIRQRVATALTRIAKQLIHEETAQ